MTDMLKISSSLIVLLPLVEVRLRDLGFSSFKVLQLLQLKMDVYSIWMSSTTERGHAEKECWRPYQLGHFLIIC
jgi:hypothetical protein